MYLEISRNSLACLKNASNYLAVLIIDPEEAFSEQEILKIKNDVLTYGLSLIIFADWHSHEIIT